MGLEFRGAAFFRPAIPTKKKSCAGVLSTPTLRKERAKIVALAMGTLSGGRAGPNSLELNLCFSTQEVGIQEQAGYA